MMGKLLALAAGALLALAGPAQASYRAIDLGTLGGFSQAADVNSAGMVVGQSGDRAFVWTKTGGMRDLGTLGGIRSGADHVTEAGQVVGYAYLDATHWHTFSWTQGDGMVDAGTLGGGNSSPWDVSDAGQIVGQSNWAGFPPAVKAFSWTPAGGIVDLGMLRLSVTVANAVNEVGQVVGWNGRAFIWSPSTGMQDVGALNDSNFSVATDVNAHGQVVGYSSGPVDGVHAFSWTAGGGMVDLGPASTSWVAVNDAGEIAFTSGSRVMFLGPAGRPIDIGALGGATTKLGGQFPSEALNDAGQLVGWSQTAEGVTEAFVWSLADGMVDLGPGQANAISENGLVAGMHNGADGTIHPVLWELRRDTTPPSLAVHDVETDATELTGTTVDYTVTATDDTDPSPTVVCEPASGTHFEVGDTTVECTATDASQNSTKATFVVHVRDAEEQVDNLADALQTLPYGLATSHGAKLQGPTVERLRAFVHEVDAQTGTALADDEAAALRAAAERVIAVLGGWRF